MTAVAVIEYEYKGYDPPPDCIAYDIQASVVHAAGVIHSTGRRWLAELRTELEEAGLARAGIAKPSQAGGRYLPTWREVWRGDDEEAADVGAIRESPSPDVAKPPEDRLLALARRALAKFPELTTRAMNAAEIARAGLIRLDGHATRFIVRSQSGDDEYHVDTEARSCTCYDWHHQAPVVCDGPMCKHRLACLMLVQLRQPVTAPDPARIHAEEKRIQALQAGALLI